MKLTPEQKAQILAAAKNDVAVTPTAPAPQPTTTVQNNNSNNSQVKAELASAYLVQINNIQALNIV